MSSMSSFQMVWAIIQTIGTEQAAFLFLLEILICYLTFHWSFLIERMNTSLSTSPPDPWLETRLLGLFKGKLVLCQAGPSGSLFNKYPCPSVQLQAIGLSGECDSEKLQQSAKPLSLRREGRRPFRNVLFIHPLEIKAGLQSQEMCALWTLQICKAQSLW
jgi:hypothetical protein